MTPSEEVSPGAQPATSQRLARLLRHEVGDLLQSIYSTVAILLERLLPEQAQERRLLSELKSRAEICRHELDAVVDLVMPQTVSPERVDLVPLVSTIVGQMRQRYPALAVELSSEPALHLVADPRTLAGSLGLLTLAICAVARKWVRVRLTRGDQEATCVLERDGFSVSAEQLAWLEHPFATTQQALFGLSLAQVRRAIEPHGGRIAVVNPSEGDVCVQVSFPCPTE